MRKLVSLALCLLLSSPLFGQVPATATQQPPSKRASPAQRARVFITDSQSWQIIGSAAAAQGGARPQTAEIIKTFGERCPAVVVNDNQNLANYVVVLEHEGGKGYLRHRNKVAVFEKISGDAVMSHSTLSLGGSVEDACKSIAQHWAAHGVEILAAMAKAPAPTPITVQAAGNSPLPTPAQSTLSIDSTPTGADIMIDGAFVGNTPSTVDTSVGLHAVSVTKKGFADWNRKLSVTGGRIHLSADLDALPQK